MNARFNLPEFYDGRNIYTECLDIMKRYPEVVFPNTEISSIFGIFPGSIWNGGGNTPCNNVHRDIIKDTIEYYNFELNMPLRFTFTNPLITEPQCFDTYSNIIAELGNNGHNEILVSNPILEKYLRDNYKTYKYCRSIIAAKNEPYAFYGTYGLYTLSVIRRDRNNQWDYLDTIPMEDRAKIEFLCNDPCPDNCPRLYTHYLDHARNQLACAASNDTDKCTSFNVTGPFQLHNMKTNNHTYISRELIDNEYLPRGFCEFKCSGRFSVVLIIQNLLNYIFKPEYRDDMFLKLFRADGLI